MQSLYGAIANTNQKEIMAVNIDTVYQKVLAMANKEQRGYITPQEFNLYADQAQLDIFERYFHDIRQVETMMNADTEFSNSLDMLEEKLNIFHVNDQVVYPTSYDGSITLPTDLYRLGEIYYCSMSDGSHGYTPRRIEVEEIKKKDIGSILQTIHTKPTSSRPIYVRLTNSTIQVYPHTYLYQDYAWDNSIGPAQYWTWGSTSNVTTTISSTTITYTGSEASNYITQYYDAAGTMPKIIGAGIPTDTTIVSQNAGTNTMVMSAAATATGTIRAYFAMGNTKCNYVKKPTTPNWSYVEINGAALYNSSNSVNFELHPSEESALVAKVLQLAGITLKDNNLLQIGAAEEGKIIQQQKQ
jgi:hypothetical protein